MNTGTDTESPAASSHPKLGLGVPRLVRWFCGKFSNHQWARRRIGGKWERWWVDCCNAWVWIETAEWSKPGQRPGGAWPSMTVIGYDGTELPKREDYSANAKVLESPDN